MKQWIKRVGPWTIVGLFAAGIIFWGGFNWSVRAHQHRALLHLVPRDAEERVQGIPAHRALHQPLGVRATCPDCHVCRRNGGRRSCARSTRRTSSATSSSAASTRRRSSRRSAWRSPRTMGAHEGERLAGMPQLPQVRVHGLLRAGAARGAPTAAPSTRARPASSATRGSRTSCRRSTRRSAPRERVAAALGFLQQLGVLEAAGSGMRAQRANACSARFRFAPAREIAAHRGRQRQRQDEPAAHPVGLAAPDAGEVPMAREVRSGAEGRVREAAGLSAAMRRR